MKIIKKSNKGEFDHKYFLQFLHLTFLLEIWIQIRKKILESYLALILKTEEKKFSK
jgi:hypothetical protein